MLVLDHTTVSYITCIYIYRLLNIYLYTMYIYIYNIYIYTPSFCCFNYPSSPKTQCCRTSMEILKNNLAQWPVIELCWVGERVAANPSWNSLNCVNGFASVTWFNNHPLIKTLNGLAEVLGPWCATEWFSWMVVLRVNEHPYLQFMYLMHQSVWPWCAFTDIPIPKYLRSPHWKILPGKCGM